MRFIPRPLAVAALALALGACAPAAVRPAAAPVTDAESLVRAMHDRYAGRWYRTLTFTQTTSRRLPNDSVSSETWLEWASIPGSLRIQMGAASEGRGALFTNDSTYSIQHGAVVRRVGSRNPLMLLGFDIYAQSPERSLAMLREEGFPLAPVRVDSWQGRPAYVLGGAPGDLHSKQLWFDQERLLFVRMIEPDPRDGTKTVETRFNRYEPAGKGWIATEVEVVREGRRMFWEEYTNVRVDVPLNPVLFQPERWSEAAGR
ncbi:MAG: hypothetical protein JO040_11710 [Gemmatimonadetes bacterium]|nr:hypothetical protein [Gemmatimonadota bacterium]